MKAKKAHAPTNLVGLGLRNPHIAYILKNHQTVAKKIGWFEVHSENYYAQGGPIIDNLVKIREFFPISLHSVGNSLGSVQTLDLSHLKKLKNLIKLIDPFLVSDHISWAMMDKKHNNDLLPLPYNQASLKAICDNISLMQDFLQRQILIENPSSYLLFKNQELEEFDFINSIAKTTGCGFLIDINNIFVSAKNNKNFDPKNYIDKIDKKIIKEIHLAGHAITSMQGEKILIDTHNDYVKKEVWDLYNYAIKKIGNTATLIEWDQDIPEFAAFLSEAKKASKIMYEKKSF